MAVSRLLPEPYGHEAGSAVDAEFAKNLRDVFVRHVGGFSDFLGDLFFTALSEK